jgi:predicted double-glycine peptidase
MLDLLRFRQKYAYDCTVASIWTVLKYYCLYPLPKYDDLVKASKSLPEKGTAPKVAMSLLQQFGLKPEYYEFASVDDLQKWYTLEIPTLVSWFSPAPGPHTSVVSCVGPLNITLMDPGIGRSRTMSLSMFQDLWFIVDPSVAERAARRSLKQCVSFREAIVPWPTTSKRRSDHRGLEPSRCPTVTA